MNMNKINYLLSTCLISLSFCLIGCSSDKGYDENYQSPDILPNMGAPEITAVYDGADIELSTPISSGKPGQNIIIDVIKNSGMMIPEFFQISQKAFTKIDVHEQGRARKEINEEMAEKRRLKSSYSPILKPLREEIKQYMLLKRQLNENEQSIRTR